MFKYDFDPNAAQKSDKPPLLEPGKASFKVRNCEQHLSKAGNPSLKLELAVHDSRNARGTIFEYLSPRASWKIQQFLTAIGQEQLYNASGALNPAHLIGETGECSIKTDVSADFGDRSVVDRFLPSSRDPNDQQQRSAAEPDDFFGDDSIPF